MQRFFSTLLCVLFLSSCLTVGEDYTKPELDITDQWNALEGDPSDVSVNNDAAPIKWWENFNDSTLSGLIEKSLDYNHDIKAAEARIKESIANHNAAFAALLPQINGVGSLKNEQLGAISGEGIDRSSDIGVRGTWDLDIFGGNKRRKEAALANIELAEAQKDSIRLAIIAETARYYIQLRQSQMQKNLILKNVKIQQNTLEGTKEKRKFGSVTELEVVRAEAQVEATKIRLLQINTDMTIALNRLRVLTGEALHILKGLLNDKNIFPKIKDALIVATPLQLVSMHPDIIAAERELASRTALTGAAFSEMFPKISLGGFFGTAESNAFGAATPWNAAGNLLFPILNFGALKAQVNAADARQESAFERYQQTVLLTVEEVENAFTSYKNERMRVVKLASVLEKREKVVTIAKEQYKAGVITQLDLLLAQQSQLEAENDFVVSEASASVNAVTLYESLGASGEDESESDDANL